ncbi:hypothetical protein LSCM1_06589 [Leishmania martiniquensis]|uniref:Uncharacterized protein n=1 Tax=Leishmania martiniquensis TaxID=1580590 RepID=A0A836HV11_9TRYP|nr:hypothetical protein LSCM1_06589 [Leishmania martiniquensis]
MPPKTAAMVVRNGVSKQHLKNGDRHPPAKEEAPVSTGPQVKSQIANSAPAPAGKSFLDALRSGKKMAVPPVAARVTVPSSTPAEEPQAAATAAAAPVAAETPAKESSAPEPAKEERVLTPEPTPVEEPSTEESAPAPAAPVEVATEVAAVPATEEPAPVMQVAGTNFNWADDDIQFQIRQPQYAAEYPASVMENMARNVTFKVPADQATMTSAIESLARERQAFEQMKRNHEDAMKSREVELNAQEASLQARERQLHANTETLAAERQQLILQQSQFRAQQAQAQAQAQVQSPPRPSQTQSPAAPATPSPAQPAPAPPLPHQMPPQHQQPPHRSGNMYMGSGYGAQEWQPDQRAWGNEGAMGAPGFDMYQSAYPGSYAQRSYHMAGGHRGQMRSGNLQQQQQFANSRMQPMMPPPQQYSRSMAPLSAARQQQMDMNFAGRSQHSYNPAPNTGYPQRSTQW